jgi:hypothetical protein
LSGKTGAAAFLFHLVVGLLLVSMISGIHFLILCLSLAARRDISFQRFSIRLLQSRSTAMYLLVLLILVSHVLNYYNSYKRADCRPRSCEPSLSSRNWKP